MTIKEYLAQLDRAAQHLDPAHRRALRDEIASHLEAAVQARVELGETHEDAVRNSIDAFGTPDGAARGFEASPGPHSRIFLIGLTGFCTLYAIAFTQPVDPAASAIMLGMVGFIGAGIMGTWRSRRFQGRSFLLLAIPTWLGVAVALSLINVTPIPGGNTLSRTGIADGIAMSERNVIAQTAWIANVEKAYARYQAEGGLLIPGHSDPLSGEFRLRRAPDEEFARRSWDLTMASLPQARARILETTEWIEAARAAQHKPWYAEIPNQLGVAALGAGAVMAIFAAPHLLTLFAVWSGGRFVRRRRQRQRGQA